VPDYDAFGREIGENTLSGLGGDAPPVQPQPASRPEPVPAAADAWPETTLPRTEPEPAPEPARVTFSVPERLPVTVMPGARRRRAGGLGCLVALLVGGAVVAGPIIAIVSIVGSASDVIDDVKEAIDPETLDLPEVTPPDATPPATGITGRSLIAKDNFAAGLREVEQAGFSRVSRIDLRPERLMVEVVKGGKRRSLEISAEGGVVRGPATPANRATGSIALSALDPAAPARLVRGAARRYPVKQKGINYLLTSPEAGGHRWRAYFKNEVYVEGDAKGRVIRRFDGV
jgi:hypothetical protein